MGTVFLRTGYNRNKSLTGLKSSLQELRVNPDHTDISITHFHTDPVSRAKAHPPPIAFI
jgi:hypothetical protein